MGLVSVLVLTALVVSLPASGAGAKTFTDPSGDSGSAPDITSVLVSNDDAGLLTFGLGLANRGELTGDDVVVIGLDTDRNAQTGDLRHGAGTDYLIGVDQAEHALALGRWNGSDYDFEVPQETLTATRDGKTLKIDRRELGGTAAFDFYVIAAAPSTTSADKAPDGSALSTYELQLTPELRSVVVSLEPLLPRAGMLFTVANARVRLGTNELVRPDSFTCRAVLAGKTLKPAGRCTWRLPKLARARSSPSPSPPRTRAAAALSTLTPSRCGRTP